jgi:phosphatidylinositol alpha-1,6-mannosyltransferase
VPEALLAVTIDDTDWILHNELVGLIDELGLSGEVAVLGSVWEHLPCLYALSEVYCTPSVMEGFGMSAAEAAATGLPVIASGLVPFAAEHLLGREPVHVPVEGSAGLLVGDGGIVAPADEAAAFADALVMLLTDRDLAARLGAAARSAVVPGLTWDRLTAALLESVRAHPDLPHA